MNWLETRYPKYKHLSQRNRDLIRMWMITAFASIGLCMFIGLGACAVSALNAMFDGNAAGWDEFIAASVILVTGPLLAVLAVHVIVSTNLKRMVVTSHSGERSPICLACGYEMGDIDSTLCPECGHDRMLPATDPWPAIIEFFQSLTIETFHPDPPRSILLTFELPVGPSRYEIEVRTLSQDLIPDPTFEVTATLIDEGVTNSVIPESMRCEYRGYQLTVDNQWIKNNTLVGRDP
jgi:hypothetical protein